MVIIDRFARVRRLHSYFDVTPAWVIPLVAMEVIADISRVSLPGSTLKRGEHVNVFWFAKTGILVDVGWNTDESFAALQAALPFPPRHVLITHLHPDHGGALERMLAWTQGDIWIPEEDCVLRDIPLPLAERLRFFKGEEPLNIEGAAIDVLLTPGHTPGHRCFLFREQGALVTGDMVLGEGSTWVGPPHGDMALYMQSLERLRGAGHRILCPGHGPMQTDPLLKIDEFLRHRRDREAQVLAALAEGKTTPAEIVARNYVDTPAYLHPLAEIVVQAHLTKLLQEDKVRQKGGQYYKC